MDRLEIQRLLALPVNERLELAQMLWRSVKPERPRQIHDGRLASMNRGREDEEPWEDVRAEL